MKTFRHLENSSTSRIFRKGQSGNPMGRRKGQRNVPAVLNDILAQTVTVKQGNNSERMTKGEATIKIIMSKAQNGDRRAIDAVSFLAEKNRARGRCKLQNQFAWRHYACPGNGHA